MHRSTSPKLNVLSLILPRLKHICLFLNNEEGGVFSVLIKPLKLVKDVA